MMIIKKKKKKIGGKSYKDIYRPLYTCNILALNRISARAAVVLHPIIIRCENINLRVDINMYARTSFPPHYLAALISFK